jgi:hypothetical protein
MTCPTRITHGIRAIAAMVLLASLGAAQTNAVQSGSGAPNGPESPWSRGVQSIGAGTVVKGIRVLDSMRLSGVSDEAFLLEYARSVFKALIPVRERRSTEVLLSQFLPTVPDTLAPSAYQWSVLGDVGSDGNRLPCFTYGAKFDIQRPFRLAFSGLTPVTPRAKLTMENPPPDPAVVNFLRNRFARRSDSLRCEVFIDLNDTRSSLSEYIARRINGVFDSVAVEKDLTKYHALSLRCYSWPVSRQDDGTFTAIVTFDRPYADRATDHGRNAQSTVRVRYTVVVRAPETVKDVAEAKLQSVIGAF